MNFYDHKTHIHKKDESQNFDFFFVFFFATNLKTKQVRKSDKYTRTIFVHELLVHVISFHNLDIFRLRTPQPATFLSLIISKVLVICFLIAGKILADI